jgi:diguanylate cyclase (GGDEF)-like protein
MNKTSVSERGQDFVFEEAAGARIDALDSLLNETNGQNAETEKALRRHLVLMRDEALQQGLPMIAVASEKASQATNTTSLRSLSLTVLSLLRGIARAGHEHKQLSAEERDRETGLLNREGFARRVEELVNVGHTPAAVAAIHVDNYECILHRHGKDLAAMLLAHVGSLLAHQLREDDCLAHFSGDEFMLLLPGEDQQGLRATLGRLEEAVIRRPFRLPGGGGQESLRISSGAYQFLEGALSATATQAGVAPLHIGLVVHTRSLGKGISHLLKQNGCQMVEPGTSPTSRFAPFSHHGARLVILESEAGELAHDLVGLRAALAHDRTPILALVANEAAGHWALDHGACEVLVKPVALDAVLRVAFRLATRGHRHPLAMPAAGHQPSVLVASDDLYQLISLGSALQRHGGYEVRLGRGSADALDQASRHKPTSALIDLRLHHDGTHKMLQSFAEHGPENPVVLVTDKGERLPASIKGAPRVAAIIEKPVPLLTLAGEFRRVTGVAPANGHAASNGIFREELLRVMKAAHS